VRIVTFKKCGKIEKVNFSTVRMNFLSAPRVLAIALTFFIAGTRAADR
jgi:hypothetical protein